MPETTWSVPIKADLRPAYYDDFHCLAAACRQSCCVGWSITFNKKDWKKVENLEMSTVGRGIWQENSEIMENEKHPLDDLKNDEITKKREK